jgi:hypothetical protein
MSSSKRHSMSRQSNALVGLIGLAIMLGGGALIVSILTLYEHHEYRVEFLGAGFALVILGWLIQYLFSKGR